MSKRLDSTDCMQMKRTSKFILVHFSLSSDGHDIYARTSGMSSM